MHGQLGPYEILRPLGAGGMGEVYEARDRRLNRIVAIKVLRSSTLQRDHARARLKREAQVIGQLNHPHICALYDVGEERGVYFLVMQYLQGETLASRLERGPLPLDQALRYAQQIAEALDAAHSQGVTHRDLKPSNIMLTNSGAILLDFGLAKLNGLERVVEQMSETTTVGLTREGAIVGTVRYMAPEVLDRKPADARSDLFSFGAVVYEMTTGRRPFEGDSEARIITAIMAEEPPPVTALRPDAPSALDDVIRKCLAKNPRERWQTARDLRDVLQLVAREAAPAVPRSSTLAEPAVVGDRATFVDRRWARSRLSTAAGVAAAGLSIVAAVALWLGMSPARDDSGAAVAAPHLVVLACQASTGVSAPEQAYCDGLAAIVAANLAQLTTRQALQVTPASEARNRGITTVGDARKQLGATLALQGTVRRDDRDVRITYALVDTATGQRLDSFPLTAGTADPFGAQDRLVGWAIAALRLPPDEATRVAIAPGTQTSDAYTFSVQGLGYLLDYQRSGAIDIAIDLFTRALTLDPTYGAAHAGLGRAYWLKYEATKDVNLIEEARSACRAALTATPVTASAYLCAGTIESGTGEYELAITLFERALQIDPTSDEAYGRLARAHEALGRFDAALAIYTRAVELRPHYWATHVWLANSYRSRGRYQDAAREYERAVALTPDNAPVIGILAGVYVMTGRYEDALRECQRSLALVRSRAALVALGMTYYRLRRFDAAAEALEEARGLLEDFRTLGNLARAYYWAGRRDDAHTLFDSAVRLGEQELAVNSRNDEIHVALADYCARLGRRDDALAHLAQARLEDPHFMFFAAITHAQLGDKPAAQMWLERALHAGYPASEVTAWIDLDNARN